MTLRVRIDVKFRTFGITWGRLQRSWDLVVPTYAGSLLHFNDRGVKLDVDAITPAAIAAEKARTNGRIHA